jgi:hypothetical protein
MKFVHSKASAAFNSRSLVQIRREQRNAGQPPGGFLKSVMFGAGGFGNFLVEIIYFSTSFSGTSADQPKYPAQS